MVQPHVAWTSSQVSPCHHVSCNVQAVLDPPSTLIPCPRRDLTAARRTCWALRVDPRHPLHCCRPDRRGGCGPSGRPGGHGRGRGRALAVSCLCASAWSIVSCMLDSTSGSPNMQMQKASALSQLHTPSPRNQTTFGKAWTLSLGTLVPLDEEGIVYSTSSTAPPIAIQTLTLPARPRHRLRYYHSRSCRPRAPCCRRLSAPSFDPAPALCHCPWIRAPPLDLCAHARARLHSSIPTRWTTRQMLEACDRCSRLRASAPAELTTSTTFFLPHM